MVLFVTVIPTGITVTKSALTAREFMRKSNLFKKNQDMLLRAHYSCDFLFFALCLRNYCEQVPIAKGLV